MHASSEEYITLSQAANASPGRPSANCVWRWCRKGIKARNGDITRLQHVRVGGQIFTTFKWLTEFGERLASAHAAYFDQQLSPETRRIVRPDPHGKREREEAIARAEQFNEQGHELTLLRGDLHPRHGMVCGLLAQGGEIGILAHTDSAQIILKVV